MNQLTHLATLPAVLCAAAALLLAGCGDSKKAADAAAAAKAAVPLNHLIDENAAFVLQIKNLPGLMKKWDASPWAKTWNDEQVRKFFAPLHARMESSGWEEKLKAETGLGLDELTALIQGDLLLGIGDLSTLTAADLDANPETFPFLIAAEIGKNKDKIETLINDALKKENTPVQTETYADTPVNTADIKNKQDKSNPLSWAIAGDKIFLSQSKTSIISAIDALKNGGAANAFGKSARYLAIAKRTGDAQVLYALNFRSIYPLINAKIAATRGKDIDYATLASTLGLDALGEIYFGGNLLDDRTEATGAITYGDKRGLLKLFAFTDAPLEIPAFASAAWPSLAVNNYSIPEAIAAIEEIVAAVSPGTMNLVDGQLAQFSNMLGLDIRRDLFDNLGDHLVTASVLPAGVTLDTPGIAEKIGALYVVDLKDARAFTGVLEAIKTNPNIGPMLRIAERDYLGVTLNTVRRGRGSKPVTFAIAKNELLVGIGSPTIVEAAVQGLVNGPASAMKDRADIRAAFADAPPGAHSFNVQNMSFTLRLLCDILPLFARRETGGLIDPAAMPDTAVFEKYWGNIHGWTSTESDGLHFTTEVYYKK